MYVFKKVVSYPDGRVIFFYNVIAVTYRKDKDPEINLINHNKKGLNGFLGSSTDVRNNISSYSRD